jgi:hypothetical protein
MTHKPLAGAIMALLFLAAPGSAQSAADLLQRGIYTQETTGDVDAAVKIYRQVVESASGNPNNNLYAAQAQYRLVLCMLLKGDPAAANIEFQSLENKFPAQKDLIGLARTMLPGNAAALPVPWGVTEVSQLNIKRDGTFTGETLYYSIDPTFNTPHQSILKWELKTRNTTRSVTLTVDSDTLRGIGNGNPRLESNDELGDAAADPFGGPAIDVQQSVFLMRRLPLAVGYKTTLPTTSFTLGQKVPKQVELAVTGIEAVQVTAGKYNCYKVSIGSLGQTFWIAVDGARPLVKFQSGKVEADLVKTWGPGSGLDAVLVPLSALGWRVEPSYYMVGSSGTVNVNSQRGNAFFQVRLTKVYTPAAEIAEALKQVIPDQVKRHQGTDFKVRPDSVQMRLVNGQQALSYIADVSENGPDRPKTIYYEVWIRTESTSLELFTNSQGDFAVQRWFFEPVVDAVHVP